MRCFQHSIPFAIILIGLWFLVSASIPETDFNLDGFEEQEPVESDALNPLEIHQYKRKLSLEAASVLSGGPAVLVLLWAHQRDRNLHAMSIFRIFIFTEVFRC